VLCPKCNSDSAHRSHRRGVTHYLGSLFEWYPYRCKCGHRFVQRRHFIPIPSGKSKAVESEIRNTRATARRAVKRRELLLFGGVLLLFAAFLYFLTRERSGWSEFN
jgi:hypothetical protein